MACFGKGFKKKIIGVRIVEIWAWKPGGSEWYALVKDLMRKW